MPSRQFRGLRGLLAVPVTAALVAVAAPAQALEKPDFQMPFSCDATWHASTRSYHSPSPLSVDFNRDAYDEGQPVVASAPGVVTSVTNLGNTSYGLYVIVDHGGDWTTLHAHLSRSFVTLGQRVDQGQVIAAVGNSGGSSGAHLHYEQRLDRSNQHAVFNGARLNYNSWVTSRNCVDVPLAGDWDGNGNSNVGTFARRATGVFRERMADGTVRRTRLGLSTNQPIAGDWDGDGTSDPGVYYPKSRRFVLASDTGHTRFKFGRRGDVPVAGDWDGNGRFEVGMFRASNHTFYLRGRSGSYVTRVLGSASSLPIAGDWDGNGRYEVGVFNAPSRTFTLLRASGAKQNIVFGTSTSLPVVGRWGRDPVTDLGVWKPATGTFVKRLSAYDTATVRFGRQR